MITLCSYIIFSPKIIKINYNIYPSLETSLRFITSSTLSITGYFKLFGRVKYMFSNIYIRNIYYIYVYWQN